MTLRSLLALIPAAAMFLAALRLTVMETRYLLLLLVGIAVFSVLLGMLQIAAGAGSGLYLYESSHQGLATAFFANRNHQGDFLVVAYIAAAALAADAGNLAAGKGAIQRIVLMCVMGICAVGTLATASRTASLLVVLAALATLPWLIRLRLRTHPRTGFLMLLALLGLALLLYYTHGVQYLIERYQNTEDARSEFWPDTIYAIRVYFPAGSGLGTFDPVFRSIEQLSIVGTHYVNDAHNDYLQVALESGVAGPVLFGLFLAYLGYAAWRLRDLRAEPFRRRSALVAIYSILLILLHCIVDYPLRTLALETVFAFLCGQMVAALREPANHDAEERMLPERRGNPAQQSQRNVQEFGEA
jgi:O-antigen ligase